MSEDIKNKPSVNINGFAYNNRIVQAMKNFNEFKENFKHAVYLNSEGKVIDEDIQHKQLEAAWAVLRPDMVAPDMPEIKTEELGLDQLDNLQVNQNPETPLPPNPNPAKNKSKK